MIQLVPVRHNHLNRASEAQMLRTLNMFAVDLMAIPSVEDLFWYVAQNVVGRLGFVDCVIYQADKAQTELKQVAAWGEKNPYGRNIINPLIIPFGSGITGQAAQTHRPIIVDDLLKDKNYIADTEPARSEICVPLIYGGRIAGVIDSEHPDISAFGEAELEILSTVAAMTSAKLDLLAEKQRSQERYEDLVTAHAKLTQETHDRKALETKLFEARKQEAIGRLAGRFAHEFNNLLTVIDGNIDLLELDAPDMGARQTIQKAKSASARGAQLIRDMLAFGQRTRLTPQMINLNVLVSQLCEECAVTLDVDIKQSLGDHLWSIFVDPSSLKNMLMALVMNAVEASDGARTTIIIETENVFHTLPEGQHFPSDLVAGRYVRLSVKDNGAGIPEGDMAQIFDPFFSTKGVGEGTGLGLSMVLGGMRQSGGSVSVKSDLGMGSTFFLYFPVASSHSLPIHQTLQE